MTPIESRANPRFQELRRLIETRAGKRSPRLAFLEGVHLCQAYLDRGHTPRQLVMSVSGAGHPEAAALCATQASEEQVLLSDQLFKSLSQLDNGVGIGFVIEVPALPAPRLERAAVILDRLQDPGNVGSILRSAAGAGIVEVFCGHGTSDVWSSKVLRAAMGAHFGLTIAENCDLDALTATSRVALCATSSHATASVFDVDLRRDVAWIFGNEGQGVAPVLLARCQAVAIPQPGGQESLNVAASAAVCLFEQVRQRLATVPGQPRHGSTAPQSGRDPLGRSG